MSDESEYDVEPEEFDIYKRKYQLLLERCDILQQVNSHFLHEQDNNNIFLLYNYYQCDYL